jgi:hypothetical protein
MRFPKVGISSRLRALAVAVLCCFLADGIAWTSLARGQVPFDARNPLAQLAKCALGEEESRSAIARDIPSQFSKIPGEARIDDLDFRVRNGAETPALWFRDTVRITSGRGVCSGVHVGGDAILTAGHCVCDFDLADAPPKVAFQMREFVHSRNIDPKRTVMLDPNACVRGAQPGRDLAVLFLDKEFAEATKDPDFLSVGVRPAIPADGAPIVPSRTITTSRGRKTVPTRLTPAIIASSEALFSGRHDRMLVVGYGADENGVIGVKRQACVPVLSGICGGPGDAERFRCSPGSELVLADTLRGADTCQGDSGGAVYTVVRDQGLYYYHLAGITSRSLSENRCGPGGIYTLITPSIVAWMRRNGVNIAAYPYPGQ